MFNLLFHRDLMRTRRYNELMLGERRASPIGREFGNYLRQLNIIR